MGSNMMQDVYVEQLNELYAAGRQGASMLPRLARAASSPELTAALRSKARAVRGHLKRLIELFEGLGASPRTPAQEASSSLESRCEECLEIAGEPGADAGACDAAIIAVAQQAEQEGIAGYGWARTWAAMLGHEEAAVTLERALNEGRLAEAELGRLGLRLQGGTARRFFA